ncbi:phage tail tip lysozyme [Nocardia sp. NBC_00403]|uniref:phage tail tip lysozyme n=1 Tax=Nocardia sp. NBC_00403 TaxID=2975990 RepID=UPI002E2284BB
MTGERYDVMPLKHPDGSSEALRFFIDWGGRAIEASLEVLGSGNTTVPDFSKRLEGDGKVVDLDEDNGSVMVKNLGELGKTVTAAKDAIHVSDKGVDTSAFATSGIAGSAFADIQDYVEALKKALNDAPAPVQDPPTKDNPNPPKYLTAKAEVDLMSAVGGAVHKTHDKVEDAQEKIKQHAAGIGGSAPSDSGRGIPASGGWGGSGGYGGSGTASPASYNGSGTPKPIDAGQQATAEEIYQYLRGKPYFLTHNEAVAILGNMLTESSFNTGAVNKGEGAIGLIQWEGGRDDGLHAFAGDQWLDWHKQVDYMMHESVTSEKDSWAIFRSNAAISPEKGAEAFAHYYERCAKESWDERAANAGVFKNSIPNVSIAV